MKGILHNVSIATVGRLVVTALGLVALRLLSLLLGVEGFGQYSIVYAYLFFVAVAADMGLGTLLTREISRPDADESSIVSSMFTLRLFLVIFAAFLGGAIVFLFPYPRTIQLGIILTSLAIIMQSMTQVLMGVFQKHLKISRATVGDVITRLVQIGGLAVLLVQGAQALLPVLWVNVLAEGIHLWFMIVAARRLVPFRIHVDIAHWKRILKSAVPIALSLVFTLLYFKIDTLMLAHLRTSAEVGIYAIAYKVLEVIIFFPAMYVGLIMPLLSRFAHDTAAFKSVFWGAWRVLCIGAVITVVGIFVFAGPIVRFIGGNEFSGAVPLLQILSLAIGFIFLGNLGGNAIIALDLQLKAVWIYGIGALFNIVMNLMFIPSYGAFAAAWSTVATEVVVTAGMFVVISRAVRDRAVRP